MSNNNYFSVTNDSLKETINDGATLLLNGSVFKLPYEYTGWREEQMASKESAYLGTYLNQASKTDICGPDAVKFLNCVCTNNFDNLKVGRIRHGVVCNERGQIMVDGVIMKLDEDLFRAYCFSPIMDFLLKKYGQEYNIQTTDRTLEEFLFQIDGASSYEIVYEAVGQDHRLNEIKFAQHDKFMIDGKEVIILRMGMTGNLAYEVHGKMSEAKEIYDYIWNIGKKKNMKKLGAHAYTMGHTEGGFSNMGLHYPMPWFESEDAGFEGLVQYLQSRPGLGYTNENRRLLGSVGEELDMRFVTPFDVGWNSLVKFDHDFTGRATLEKIAENPPRAVVTLEWNVDDIMDIYGSQFRGKEVEPYDYIDDRPNDMEQTSSLMAYFADKVVKNGEQIGISVGRQVSQYYHRMISLAYVKPEFAKLGTELEVVWGYPGHPQKLVRTKVAPFPYLNLTNNRSEDAAK